MMIHTPSNRLRRIFALMLAMCLLTGLLPAVASAADALTGVTVRDVIGADGTLTGKFGSTPSGGYAAYSGYGEIFATLHWQNSLSKETTPEIFTTPDTSVVIPKADGPSSDFSVTNVRTKGIDEPDMIKTDGKFIYTVDDRYGVTIVDAASMKIVKTIVSARQNGSKDVESFRGVMVAGSKMVIVSEVYFTDTKTAPTSGYYSSYYVYDISKPQAPSLLRSVRVRGLSGDTRLLGDTLYATTSQFVEWLYPDSPIINALPIVQDSATDNAYRAVEPGQIWRLHGDELREYTNIVSFPISSKQKASVRCEATYSSFSYMSANAMYLFRNNHSTDAHSSVNRYSLTNGLSYTGNATIPGYVLNEYAADEYGGNLRVATTDSNGNHVLVFDSALKQIGSVENLAKGESIQSVRFMGDAGYVVTYRNVDPLFTLDLSSPSSPRVLGQLKIPGFSSYLHPFGTNYLVGIGRETAELSYVNDKGKRVASDNVKDLGLKISLFDVSKPTSPKEVAKALVGGSNSYSAAPGNPRSILVDESLGLIAFPASIDTEGIDIAPQYLEGQDSSTFSGGVIMSVAPPKLSVKGYIKSSFASGSYNSRFCRIGDGLYFLVDNLLGKYDVNTLAEIGTLKLR